MTTQVNTAFEFGGVVLKLDQLIPTKQAKETLRQTPKYRTILASIREVGVVEPLIVHPQESGKFLLLDGHARVEALKELGIDEAYCLLSKEDEGYTYNHQVNRVAPIQANKMILRALDAGVSEERIARALALSSGTVRRSRTMLQGICPEAIELLKDKAVPIDTFRQLKKARPLRQIEMAELMVAAGNYSKAFANALFVATPKEHLVAPREPRKGSAVRPEDMARMEHEMQTLEKDFMLVEESYGRNVVDLTLARSYVKKLLDNGRVVRYLAQNYRDHLAEFQRIVEAASLES